MSVGRCNDFDDIAILQFCSQRNDTVVDLDRSGMVADIRMDIVGKIQRGCGPGQSDDFGLRGENIYGVLEKIDFDMAKSGYSLCITDTKGSHVDLTADYAAVPAEMCAVAEMLGKPVLNELSEQDIIDHMADIRTKLGDRYLLRALHYFEEVKRVEIQVASLTKGDMPAFLAAVKASGDSSFKYLQNVYTNKDIQAQNVSVALAVSDITLGSHGVSRVHGGGFAGTIQAFVENDTVETYRQAMDHVFGGGSCHVLKIRKYGGMQVL